MHISYKYIMDILIFHTFMYNLYFIQIKKIIRILLTYLIIHYKISTFENIEPWHFCTQFISFVN